MNTKLANQLTMTEPTAPHSAFHNVSYGNRERNVLDLFLPTGSAKPPLLLYIHGGSWFRGDKNQVLTNERLAKLIQRGFAVATMNYTYSQEAVWPAQRDDVVLAMEYLQSKEDHFGYDCSELVLWGQSSGGHLALWAGSLSAQSVVSDISAMVCWFPPSNLFRLWPDREEDNVPRGNEDQQIPTAETRVLGVNAQDNKELAEAASPEIAVAALDPNLVFPPTLLIHGDADPAVSPLQSVRMRDVLAARGGHVELIEVPEGGHSGTIFDVVVDPCIEFLASHVSALSS